MKNDNLLSSFVDLPTITSITAIPSPAFPLDSINAPCNFVVTSNHQAMLGTIDSIDAIHPTQSYIHSTPSVFAHYVYSLSTELFIVHLQSLCRFKLQQPAQWHQ